MVTEQKKKYIVDKSESVERKVEYMLVPWILLNDI